LYYTLAEFDLLYSIEFSIHLEANIHSRYWLLILLLERTPGRGRTGQVFLLLLQTTLQAIIHHPQWKQTQGIIYKTVRTYSGYTNQTLLFFSPSGRHSKPICIKLKKQKKNPNPMTALANLVP